MQTFMPYSDPVEVARVLGVKRLGAQRREADQILRALATGGAWSRHPATLAWRGHEPALRWYRNCMLAEWLARGYKLPTGVVLLGAPRADMPTWAQSETVQYVHRANLVRKDPDRYGALWPDAAPLDGYLWCAPDAIPGEASIMAPAADFKPTSRKAPSIPRRGARLDVRVPVVPVRGYTWVKVREPAKYWGFSVAYRDHALQFRAVLDAIPTIGHVRSLSYMAHTLVEQYVVEE